ncbi:uncharacterized protein LOC133792078 [Humulus lupulus]|uniref:uncharacterized protein LOC133792078 n=1 Tax=Humulus lupulus TaxID=3486 RepID=UPI002B401464|nr:uncharacterized protein LOC133792078 [Humulus lupulus]
MVTRKRFVNLVQFVYFTSSFEPKNVKEALSDESWIKTMQEELEQFTRNETWTLVHRPNHTNVIVFSLSRATMVKTRGSGSQSIKDLKGKVVVIPDLETAKAPSGPPSSAVPLTTISGSSKKVRASLSDDVSDHEVASAKTHSDSTESPDVLAPEKKNKGWFQVSSSRKFPQSKGTNPSDSTPKASYSMGSTPLSTFRTKVKNIPPPCSSSESDPSESFAPSDDDPLEDDASIDDDVASKVESDPSEDPSISPKHYVHRDVICEKKIMFSAHRVFGVIKNIEDRVWLGSLIGFDGFVPRVVHEFYVNLNDDLFDSKSFMFGQVYVRGHWYLFSVVEIAKVLNVTSVVINDVVDFNKDKILSELVGEHMVWEQHSVLIVTDLTHYYAMLHKFFINSWIPTTHTSTITFDTTFFLFNVGTGLQVDLATLIFYQITALGKAKKKGQYLVFPHWIYKLLDSKKPLWLEYEIVTPPTAGC